MSDSVKLSLGDIVCWTSQAGAYHRVKQGEIVEIVHAGKMPEHPSFKCETLLPHTHESYIVHAKKFSPTSLMERPRSGYYWPRVCHLKKVE